MGTHPVRLAFRFLLEAAAWIAAGFTRAGMAFGGLVVLHYLLSLDRIVWLPGR